MMQIVDGFMRFGGRYVTVYLPYLEDRSKSTNPTLVEGNINSSNNDKGKKSVVEDSKSSA